MEKVRTSTKLKAAAPYNILYNTIPQLGANSQAKNSVSFGDLLCPSLGELKCSLFITSKVDIKWLMKQYEEKNLGNTPISLLYFEYKPEMERYIDAYLPNVTQHCITVSTEEGLINHHSRIGIFLYKNDTLRVIVTTANFTQIQWDNFHHGIWFSPLCHLLPETSSESEGESPTGFKSSLLNYLEQYKLPEFFNFWTNVLKRTDFSDVTVFLVTSVTGKYDINERKSQSQKMEDLLKKHCHLPKAEENSWAIIAQSSSFGKFGDSPDDWLESCFLRSLSRHVDSKEVDVPSIPLKIIFPTWLQVKRGLLGEDIASQGLRYMRSIHNRQTWLKDYLYMWKAKNLDRSKVMPHCKTYCRVSPSETKMAWFFLTTSNINRGSWGDTRQESDKIYVRNFEAGVLFFPKFFGEEFFNVGRSDDRKVFPMIYNFPLKKYGEKDHPWTTRYFGKLRQKFM